MIKGMEKENEKRGVSRTTEQILTGVETVIKRGGRGMVKNVRSELVAAIAETPSKEQPKLVRRLETLRTNLKNWAWAGAHNKIAKLLGDSIIAMGGSPEEKKSVENAPTDEDHLEAGLQQIVSDFGSGPDFDGEVDMNGSTDAARFLETYRDYLREDFLPVIDQQDTPEFMLLILSRVLAEGKISLELFESSKALLEKEAANRDKRKKYIQ